MKVYRLGPIDPDSGSWRFSKEYDIVWACAPNPRSARHLVASRTGVTVRDAEAVESPWENEAVTSCVPDPSMSRMRAETVVRQDGSLVRN